MTEEYKAWTCKVVLIGDSGVGKTTLINRYVMDNFDAFEPPTISGGFRKKEVIVDEAKTKVSLQIWDTAGQEKFKALVENYYKNAQSAIVVYDITSEESFDAARTWIKEVKEKAPEDVIIFIWGSKSDLDDQRRVELIHGMKLAKENDWLFGETSAKKNIGVQDAFEALAKKYAEIRANKPKDPSRDTITLGKKKEKKKPCKW